MNPRLAQLHPYPFERLRRLKSGLTPTSDAAHIALSIGEPGHQPPACVVDSLRQATDGLANYPSTQGSAALRETIATWLGWRFNLSQVDSETQVLPVNGTREALFAIAQTVVAPGAGALVLMPNPFYQIYEGAALLAGAEPFYLNCDAERGFIPDWHKVPASVWRRCRLLYVCTPSNPSGTVIPPEDLATLIHLADEHDFVIASDECYTELYSDDDAPPAGLLQICAQIGRHDFRRCLVFHSLSKRSNLPGLRAGFVAGDAGIIKPFLHYRTYQGCAMSPLVQAASIAAWRDERHVRLNRDRYREKFDRALAILAPVLDVQRPAAGFYLWPQVPMDDEVFARDLFIRENVTVLPGQYLSRDTGDGNPGRGRIRMALVADLDTTIDAMQRLRRFIETR